MRIPRFIRDIRNIWREHRGINNGLLRKYARKLLVPIQPLTVPIDSYKHDEDDICMKISDINIIIRNRHMVCWRYPKIYPLFYTDFTMTNIIKVRDKTRLDAYTYKEPKECKITTGMVYISTVGKIYGTITQKPMSGDGLICSSFSDMPEIFRRYAYRYSHISGIGNRYYITSSSMLVWFCWMYVLITDDFIYDGKWHIYSHINKTFIEVDNDKFYNNTQSIMHGTLEQIRLYSEIAKFLDK